MARSISPASRHLNRAHLHPDRRRHGLDCAELAGPGRLRGIANDCRPRHGRCDLLEQLQPFSADAILEESETSGVAAGPRQAIDEPGADRVGDLNETRSGPCASPATGAPRLRLPDARMTSGASVTNSAAYLRMSSASPAPQR